MEKSIITDIQIYLLTQFVDVLDEIKRVDDISQLKNDIKMREKLLKDEIQKIVSKTDIFELDKIDKTLDEKLEKYSKLYCESLEYKERDKKIRKLEKEIGNTEKLEELENCIYEKCDLDSKFAYKIGMIEAIKILTI